MVSEEQELERLRADQEVLERYFCDGCARVVQDKIAALEAEAADPWREARLVLMFKATKCKELRPAVDCIDHLTAENDRLTKRVAELDIAYCHVNDEADRLTKRVAELEKASEIVRRLATYINERQLFVLIEDAQNLWESMKGAGDE